MTTKTSRILAPALIIACLLAAPAHADDLLGLYREAIKADANYLVSRADNRAQREVRAQAQARLLPNVSFSGSYSRNDVERKQSGSDRQDFDYKSNSMNLTLRQPIIDVSRFRAWQQSKAQVAGVDANLAWATQDVGTRIGQAYFDVLQAQSDLDVIKAQRDAYLTQLEFAQKSFQAGGGSRTDIDEARAQLDQAAAKAIEQQYQLTYTEDALKALVNRPLTGLARLNPERLKLGPPSPNNVGWWVGQAEQVNPQLIALRASVTAAERQVQKARAGHLPTVDLIAQGSRSKNDNSNYVSGNSHYTTKSTMVGVQLDVPLLAGGETSSAVRQASAELDKAQASLEAARRDVGLQIRKAFDGMTQGVSWVTAYTNSVESAERALASTRKGFQAGTRSTLDILTAEQTVANARSDLNRGRFQYITARIRLMALIGKLDDKEIGRINAWLE